MAAVVRVQRAAPAPPWARAPAPSAPPGPGRGGRAPARDRTRRGRSSAGPSAAASGVDAAAGRRAARPRNPRPRSRARRAAARRCRPPRGWRIVHGGHEAGRPSARAAWPPLAAGPVPRAWSRSMPCCWIARASRPALRQRASAAARVEGQPQMRARRPPPARAPAGRRPTRPGSASRAPAGGGRCRACRAPDPVALEAGSSCSTARRVDARARAAPAAQAASACLAAARTINLGAMRRTPRRRPRNASRTHALMQTRPAILNRKIARRWRSAIARRAPDGACSSPASAPT